MSNLKLFGLTMVCTMAVGLGYFCLKHSQEESLKPKLTEIRNGVFLTSQLKPSSMRYLRQRQIKTVIDMRPDGEAADQPSSEQMRRTAEAMSMEFHYIPVPHEGIPNDAVDSLQSALKTVEEPVVLYCRTGRRAARLFALAKASQGGGPSAEEILGLVRAAGFEEEDLAGEIARRIANRDKPLTGGKP